MTKQATYFAAGLCRSGTLDEFACVSYGPNYETPDGAREVARQLNLQYGFTRIADEATQVRFAVFEFDAKTGNVIRCSDPSTTR